MLKVLIGKLICGAYFWPKNLLGYLQLPGVSSFTINAYEVQLLSVLSSKEDHHNSCN